MPRLATTSRRALPLLGALAATIAAACSADHPPTQPRAGDRAVVFGHVLDGSGRPVSRAVVRAVGHPGACSSASNGASNGAVSAISSAIGAYRANLPTVAGDQLCVVLTAQVTLGTVSQSGVDSVTLGRNTAVSPLVFDTAAVDIVIE